MRSGRSFQGHGQVHDRDGDAEHDGLHWNILLSTLDACLCRTRFLLELTGSQSYGTLYHAGAFYYAYDSGRGNAADTDVTRIFLEYLFRGHLCNGLRDSCSHKVDHLSSPDEVHHRNDDQPYKE